MNVDDGSHARWRRRCLTLGAWPLLRPLPAAAEPVFPQRPVRLVVPYAVGVGPDVVARALGETLQARWGQPVVIENKPGAAGIVAFSDLRQAAADGHTLYLADAATLVVNPLLQPRLPYDPATDVEPLTLLFRATFALWTGAHGRHATLAGLLRAASREPRRISYASLGHGHPSHVFMEGLAHAAGLQLLHVPFKDAGALMSAVVAGDVDLTPFSHHTVAGLAAQGRLRALAVAAPQRLGALPDVPTLAEAGAPVMDLYPWAAWVTRRGTAPAIVQRLLNDLHEAMEATEVRERVRRAGFELTPSSPQGLRDRIEAERRLVLPLLAAGRLAGS